MNSALYRDPKWRLVQGYTSSVLAYQKISEMLLKKEKKASKYTKCDEYWLLIVIDSMDRAQDQELPEGDAALKSNIYKKIIVYKTVFNEMLEINAASGGVNLSD